MAFEQKLSDSTMIKKIVALKKAKQIYECNKGYVGPISQPKNSGDSKKPLR